VARGGPRPGAGRKRKDPELKKLAGTLRKDRDLVPATSLVAVPAGDGGPAPMIAPIHLSELAQLIFRDVAGMLEQQGRAAPEYAQHVALLALRLEQVQRFQAVLETEGDTFTSKTVKKVGGVDVISTMIRARPEVAMLSDAMRQAQSLIGELMLNPSAALRIASGHKPQAGAFDDF
jgi:phage terminase small subunit